MFLLAAVLFGAAAAFLSGPPQVPPSPGSREFLGYSSEFGFQLLGLGIFVAVAGVILWSRRGGTMPFGGRPLVTFAAVFLVALLFLILARFVASGGDIGRFATNRSSGGPSSTPPPSGNASNLTLPIGIPPVAPGIPGWIVYAGLIAAAAVAALVLLPRWVEAARERAAVAAPAPPPAADATLREALATLEDTTERDPRAKIVRLYGQLLSRVAPRIAPVEPMTAREIELECVRQLHMSAATSAELRELFEEARYSTHPMDEGIVARARRLLTRGLDEARLAGDTK